ncbi:MAG TPA: sarcosine oxidase subunit alpha family protein [Casimicrobiaceae bacterium]|nr:sarcosine oxidase subunit alpha family protein [Casimicrobiaceae bacterium]
MNDTTRAGERVAGSQSCRLAAGGTAIDRSRALAFEYDGMRYEGYAGDTLASALLANGVHLVARSFKYHRPRGIFSAGVEEPSALVQLARGARTEPNTRATVVELYAGLSARSQNCWPSVRFDAGAIANALSPLLPAGFYYKTFMWPPTPKWWLRYERFIRGAAGMGRAASEPDPDRYEHQFAHCDVLVIGGGPAGLAAARAAAASGARVIVCHQSAHFASNLTASDATIDGHPAAHWTEQTLSDLRARADVSLLARTTAFGYYDDNLVGAVERVTDHLAAPPSHLPRQRLWLIRARAVVLASGAIERGLGYGNNDLPGTLLAGAAQAYVTRYGVRLGQRAVLFANNDAAYASALTLHAAGIPIGGIVDARSEDALRGALPERARSIGLAIMPASVLARAHGRLRVSSVDVMPRGGGTARRIDCDVLLVSGGCSPTVHLFSHARGTLRYDAAIGAFFPDASPLAIACAGAVNGEFDFARAIDNGAVVGRNAAASAVGGRSAAIGATPGPRPSVPIEALSDRSSLPVEPPSSNAKCFIDLQNDVTVRDLEIAAREGYTLAEHLKRYTTLGMGTDQGKTSNLAGMALLAARLRVPVPDVGTTTFRPPYTPVTLGAIAGTARGAHVEPTRRTAMHAWHAEHGARFVNAGLWKRPHSYPRRGESEDDAADREARNVRSNVGVVDVSTLGKIELQGRDVAEFLNRIYINRFDTLTVGRCRYGVMLREDGIVRDDGTMSRLDDTHFLMTTTTANAVAIMQYIERLLQLDWPELDVHATSVTEQWAAAAVSGPKSRALLARVVDIDVANEAFPFLAVGTCMLRTADNPIPARLFRMSYSGELAYEVHVPSRYGRAMWDAIIGEGDAFGLMPYGTEAMNTLRVEKGHVVIGSEIDGRTTAADLGMEKLVNPNKWCVGKPLLARAALNAPDRWQLVGLIARGGATIPRGAKIVADPDRAPPVPMLGHVTSWCASPHVGASIALALVAGGRARHGESLWAVSPLADARVLVDVGPSCFVDPDGERLRG